MNDEQLILYYYDDGLGRAERRAIERALRQDPALARRYAELARELDALRETAPVEAPEGLADRLRATVHRAARLEQAERESPRRGWHAPSFLFGGAVTAALAAVLAVGLWLGGKGPVPPDGATTVEPVTAEWSQAAFQRGLKAHFRASRLDLQGLAEDGASEREVLIASLLEQNRVYTRLAEQNDAPDLARVLRSFQPVLARLAAEDLAPDEADGLRAQLEFEIDVMLTKLARQSSDEGTSTQQELNL